ncbi:MAG: cysteine desulfurase [Spirochaetes bacterium]|nr:cysteine desulfurase [Spirochaetota bacterium]MBU1082213.1 cysteine desulfurase [Spirochaetota bacterium]
MAPCYLDWAASAPPYPDLLEQAAAIAYSAYGNPSSLHATGKSARAELEAARSALARSIGAEPGRVSFTSGGTEADSIPMLSTLLAKGERSIVISAIEHAAVFEQARVLEELGVKVIRVRPAPDGIVDPAAVADAVRRDTVLVSVMAVNNETGAVQPIGAIADALRSARGGSERAPFFHCDAVQALGTVGFDAAATGVDGAAFSAHKLGGPRGIGALFLGRPVTPLARGGGQEGGIRPGTHNTPGAWAFCRAAERAASAREASLARARLLERALLDGARAIPGVVPLPAGRLPGDERYSPYIACLAFPGLSGEVMARLLDEAGIAVSTGAACSGAKKERRVLDAMGVARDLSFSSIRVSTGRDTAMPDIELFLERAASAYARYRV